ncbi:cation diffusion facilitator family transporter [Sulfuriroseicoccus oceanibius]|uniref:Cation transporter n=1 Tax=Sulfuriroseicoccus oceanibius TaxID=2707525 RepID=A0A6B3LAV2_9BACT|nr:cation diffusion facilitator family transporter [Sulfuriroseicoccus oceanibius]QQL44327.1 cation transporter [Sulfuriroseicoccus oceanibius]
MNGNRNLIGLGLLTLLFNVVLMVVKIVAGVIGHSTALIADGVESASDILVSLVTWAGFYLSLRPPDRNHPFGHGRIESLAGMFSGGALVVAGVSIAVMSVHEIRTPHEGPAWFTLPVLLCVVAAKEFLARRIQSVADVNDSRALEGDAWHHRSDALTSGAAAVGIAIALIGGEKYAAADDYAALVACVIILLNGGRIISRSLHENLDGRVDSDVSEKIVEEAALVSGVEALEKCVVRKSGVNYFAELHVEVDPNLTVHEGHRISHEVKDHLLAKMPQLEDVVIHIEPHE